MNADTLDEIETRWNARREWIRDYEDVGDEHAGVTGSEPVGSSFFTWVKDEDYVDYVPDRMVGDALEEARKDIAALIEALRSH